MTLLSRRSIDAPDAPLRPRRRVLHTSDVHLGMHDDGSAGRGAMARARAESEAAFRGVIDVGLRERVDCLLIAGDFFDNARVSEETLRFAAAEIARADVPTLIVPGNHDHVGHGSVYDRIDLETLAPNLTVLRTPEGAVVAFEGLGIAVWGRAHLAHDRVFAPFAGAPGRAALREQVETAERPGWYLGVGHGHYVHAGSGAHPSFHIRASELAALEQDYTALGHWEQQTRVEAGSRVAAYSGAPDGQASVLGPSGRVLVVDLEPDGRVRLASHAVDGSRATIVHDEIPLLRGL